MNVMRLFGILLASMLVAGGVTAALAQQQPVSALKGHNTNAPVDVTAQRLEVQDRADRAVFVGNVRATQGDLTMDTERLTIAYSSSQSTTNGIQIERIDAAGGVVVRTPSETAKGDFGIYDTNRKLITVLGNVQLSQGANRLSGARLVIDLDSGRAVIDGGPPGVNSTGGRVTGHFTVPQKR
jgi:lipopolysaccharide export system protein LptA